jgi:curved DNA-binding protein CbpA
LRIGMMTLSSLGRHAMTPEALQHYAVLGVPATATVEEIKARYKALLAEARSKIGARQINVQGIERLREAYSVLADPARRAGADRGTTARADVREKPVLRLVDMDIGEAAA